MNVVWPFGPPTVGVDLTP